MAVGKHHVSAFSPDGKFFALVNDQGVLKIWDFETNELKQEYTPDSHLAGTLSALQWLQISSKKKLKKSLKTAVASTALYIALGKNTGGVSLYSYSLGKIERDLKGGGHSGKITSICYNASTSTLYTCGDDCNVITWCISQGKQIGSFSVGNEKPYSISYLERSNVIVIGARLVKIYSLESQELIQSFLGHTSEILLLQTFFANNIEYVVTASKTERIICLWEVGKKNKNKAVCSLLMEDVAHFLTCQLDDEGNVKVAGVTRSGVIHVYLIPPNSLGSEKPIKPNVTVEVVSDSTTIIQLIPAISASFNNALKNQILIAYGDKHFLFFEQITPNFSEKVQVLVRSDPKEEFSKLTRKEQIIRSSLKTVSPLVNENEVEFNTGIILSRKKLKPVEMPLESRLQNLNVNVGEKPQPQSKVQLLMQALHSRNASMLMMVLATNDKKVVEMTLQKLPVQYVGTLVNELTLMMQKKRVNVETSANWFKILAQTHSSQLMAMGSDNLLDKFGPCIGIIEHRSNCLQEISKLNGRLQMLVSQIKRNKEEDNLTTENALLYEDEDSSNSDVDDEMAARSISDGEWEEDRDSMDETET